MMRTWIKSFVERKKLMKCFISSAVVALVVISTITIPFASAANVNDAGIASNENIKVFVGGCRNPLIALKYKLEKTSLLRELAAEKPDDSLTATLVLDGFIGMDEAQALLDKYDLKPKGGCFWPKNTQGRVAGEIPGETLRACVDTFLERAWRAKAEAGLPEDSTYYLALKKIEAGDFGFFALLVNGAPEKLLAAAKEKHVALVDPHYNASAEAKALKQNRKVSYIVLVSKPDGTT